MYRVRHCNCHPQENAYRWRLSNAEMPSFAIYTTDFVLNQSPKSKTKLVNLYGLQPQKTITRWNWIYLAVTSIRRPRGCSCCGQMNLHMRRVNSPYNQIFIYSGCWRTFKNILFDLFTKQKMENANLASRRPQMFLWCFSIILNQNKLKLAIEVSNSLKMASKSRFNFCWGKRHFYLPLGNKSWRP